MKIKTRPGDAGMLESDEWFQTNGWLAELRRIRQAESKDDGRPESEDDGQAEWKDDGWAESKDDGQAESKDGGQAEWKDEGWAEWKDDGQAESKEDGQAEWKDEGWAEWKDGSRAGLWEDGRAEPQDGSQAGLPDAGRAGLWGNGRSEPPGHGYARQEALAVAPLNRPYVRPAPTARALIGDELRRPIAWCELDPCISWYADPAALGEADIRARAISAGWRVDAIGFLVCPQCQQTAPGFRSPLPVALWNRGEAIAAAASIATEAGDAAVSIAAQELSHDLRLPAEDRRDEAIVASTWMPAVPSHDAVASATREDRNESGRPASDQHPENRPRSGRHRKRLVAKLKLASH
jgi:hypothetical protein